MFFSSSRMRMSVVMKRVRDQSYVLFVKGADEVIVARSSQNRSSLHLRSMCIKIAENGFRVLMMAKRELGLKECAEFVKRYNVIQGMVNGRDEAREALADVMERNLSIVGVTGIEDRLQESVSETMHSLRMGNIKIWMLTGDKLTTATTIAFNTSLLTKHQRILYLKLNSNIAEPVEQLNSLERQLMAFQQMLLEKQAETASSFKKFGGNIDSTNGACLPEYAVVITGPALRLIFGSEDQDTEEMMSCDAFKLLTNLVAKSAVVIACRVSPFQKAQLVSFVRNTVARSALTLAIGDGANDVPMLQKAHIGVGINGHEGMQAANNSDFTIARFKFLKRLLLIHGRWNYRRLALVVRYSFYKNFVLVLVLFFYSNFTGFSGTTLFDGLLLSGYNVFLFWPILCAGVFDQDVDEADILEEPGLYDVGRLGEDLNILVVIGTVFKSVVHAVIVFGLPYLAIPSLELQGMAYIDLYGQLVFLVLLVVMLTRSCIITNTWTLWSTVWFVITVGLTIIVFLVYSSLNDLFPDMTGVYLCIFSTPITYILCISSAGIVLVIDLALVSVRRMTCPTKFEQTLRIHHEKKGSIRSLQSRPTDYCCSCLHRKNRRHVVAQKAYTTGDIEMLEMGSPPHSTFAHAHNSHNNSSIDDCKIEVDDTVTPNQFSSSTTTSLSRAQHPIFEQKLHIWRPRWSFASPDADCQLPVCVLGWSIVLLLTAILLLFVSENVSEYSFVYSHADTAAQWNFFAHESYQTVVDTTACVPFTTTKYDLVDFLTAAESISPHVTVTNDVAQTLNKILEISPEDVGFSDIIPLPVAAQISAYNDSVTIEGELCHITVNFVEYMSGPVYVLYGVGGMHQNVQFYKEDAPWNWLRDATGQESISSMTSECSFKTFAQHDNSRSLAPCGLLANSLFNDSFALVGATTAEGLPLNMSLSTQANVPGPRLTLSSNFVNHGINDSVLLNTDDQNVQYLYETFPETIKIEEGASSALFERWMLAAPFLSFRKQYGRLIGTAEGGVEAGTNLTFLVTSTYDTQNFRGSKTFVIANAGK